MSARGERGMSLLEVLVAMTLLGLLGAMVAGGVRFGVAVWERGSAAAQGAAEARVALKALRRAVSGAMPIRYLDGTRQPPVAFDGGPERLRFVGRLPARIAPPGETRMEIALGEPGRLVLRHAPLDDRAPALPPGAAEEVLLDGVASLRLRYLGPLPGGGALAWQPRWEGRAELPRLVEIRVAPAGPAATPHRLVAEIAAVPR